MMQKLLWRFEFYTLFLISIPFDIIALVCLFMGGIFDARIKTLSTAIKSSPTSKNYFHKVFTKRN